MDNSLDSSAPCHCGMPGCPGHGPLRSKTRRDVEQYGWSQIWVDPCTGEADSNAPDFCWAYTVGLNRTFDHPEILLSNVPADPARKVVSDIVSLVKSGRQLIPGARIRQLLPERELYVVSIDPKFLPFQLGVAFDFYEHQDFPAIQLVWSDKQGRYPWDSAYAAAGQEVLVSDEDGERLWGRE